MTVWLTPSQVSRIIGFQESTLANWRSSGKGPEFVKIGARVRYDEAVLTEWQAAQVRR